MRTYSIPFVCVISLTVAGLLSTACDSETSRRGPLQPTGISSLVSPSEFAVGIRPTRLDRRSIAGAFCPFRHPFFVPLELFVENTSLSTVFLNRVGFQFIDSFGTVGPQIVNGQDTLMRRFGHVGLPPDSSRVFPFSVEFGCGTLPHGKIDVAIETIDARRTPRERSFTVFVR